MTQTSTPTKPLISIGLITYNNPLSEIQRCLYAIFTQTYGANNIEVIIRNQGNQSLVPQMEQLVQDKGWQQVAIHHGENLGFGGGHNQLFSLISKESKAYLCLNPDGFLHDTTIEKMVDFLEKNQWSGIVDAIHEPIMHPKTFHPKTGLTEWCSGACVLIPNYIYQQINGFDEDFFLYCEDVDLSWRVRANGYQCYTCFEALFFHYAMDRVSREAEMWRSATYLAHKWRSENFKKMALERWESHVDMDRNTLLHNVEQLPQHSFEEVVKVSPNFKTGLYFAKPMWS